MSVAPRCVERITRVGKVAQAVAASGIGHVLGLGAVDGDDQDGAALFDRDDIFVVGFFVHSGDAIGSGIAGMFTIMDLRQEEF
jgi:hypothetical protein